MDKILIYITLRLIVLFSCFIVGKKVMRGKRYMPLILIPIIAFTLNEGLRFGRGVDYNGYFFKYNDIIKFGSSEAKEFLFVVLCNFNDWIGFSYQGLILILSFILISASVYFLKDHKTVLPYALPLFTLFSLDAENLIRWFLGFSFVIIGISFLYNQKKMLFFTFSIIGALFHTGIFLLIPIFYLLYLLRRPILPWYLSIAIYFLLFFLFKTDYMLNLVKYVQFVNILPDQQFSGYISNADAWLTGKANYVSTGLNVGIVINDILIILLGYKVISIYPKLMYFFNIYLLGVILSPAMYQIEILLRIDVVFKLFQFIILAYAIKAFMFKKRDEYVPLYSVACWLVCLNIMRIYIFNILYVDVDTNNFLYVWDSMGRSVLNM